MTHIHPPAQVQQIIIVDQHQQHQVPFIPAVPPPVPMERYSSIPPHPFLDNDHPEQQDQLIMDNSNNHNPSSSLQHQQQQQRAPPRKAKNQKAPLRPLPAIYKIQLHLRRGEPLERRRLTHGLPDPEPYDHVQGQDSYIILREKITARVARHPELLWPEDGVPYIKPAESVPQKYYQKMTADNYEDQMAKAWRQEAKRLPDESLIVLNIFIYLKDRDPKEPGVPGRPPGRPPSSAAAAGGDATATRSPRPRPPRPVDGPAGGFRNATEAEAGFRPRPMMVPGAAAPGRGAPNPTHPRPPGRPGRPPLPPHLRRPPPPPGSHAAGGGPGPIRRGPGRPLFRPPPPGMQGLKVRPSAVDQAIRDRTLTSGEAVVAAVNSPIVTIAASSSPSSTTPAAAAGSSTPSSSASSSSSSSLAITTNIPTLVSVALPPPSSVTTRTQAPRAASARHRLSAIPQIHPPPPPPAPSASSSTTPAVDRDHDMEDVSNNDNHFDDLMQDDFDQGLGELPPQRTYDIHAPPSPSPPPLPATPTSSSSAASGSEIHTYSIRPHPLGPQPQHKTHAQTAQAGRRVQAVQAGGGGGVGDDEDFKMINVKINGLVVPMLFEIKSLREAIFS